eukprot:TRINITY_DN6184_c0_g1_i1.p1 TRINITY_DN6184_c0_g1~~TRINITY_DN6184_c0_g1_i1.p1  ORF type:complete len:509 (-),score=63.66 TRINITY_DN6184_c0_g1_i1:201-1727(-)
MGKIARNLKQKIIEPLVRTERRHVMGNYRFDRTIAEGLYGKIKLAYHIPTGQKVVVKVILKRKLDIPYNEADLLAQLRHIHIVRLLEVLETPEKQYIVCDFVEGGELYDYIMDKGHLDEDEARGMWRQLISAVDYMHRRNIAHRDLKLENVMLDKDKNLVLIDLGLGSFMTPGKSMKTFCGSVAYAAPEMFMSQMYSGQAVDIWSLGVTLYCMVMGYLPFEDPQRVIEADYIPLNESIDETGTFMRVSTEFVDLIDRIFQRDPQHRITMDEIMSHPWTNKGLSPMIATSVSTVSTNEIPLPIITGPRSSSNSVNINIVAPTPVVKQPGSPPLFVSPSKTLSMPMPLRSSSPSIDNSSLVVPMKRNPNRKSATMIPCIPPPDVLSNLLHSASDQNGGGPMVKPLVYYHCSAAGQAANQLSFATYQPSFICRSHNPSQCCGRSSQNGASATDPSALWEQSTLNTHLVEKLLQLGHDRGAIEASVNQCIYDPITASLYLLNKKESQMAVEA